MGHMGKVLNRQYKGDWAAQWKTKAKSHAEVHESAGLCFRRVVTSSSRCLLQSDQTTCRLQHLTLFHNLVPLTIGHAVPRSPPPIFTLVSFHYFPMIHLEQSPYGTPFCFLSVSTAHCLYSYYNNYSIDYWNCLFAGIVLLKPGAMVPHPHIPSITYSAWHFRNTENNVCLCFNKGCTYSS